MSIRNLEYLFKPSSIALIGASRRAGSVGAAVARNLFRAGFDGPVMPVNPKHTAVEGVLAYPDVASLPIAPDLAVITTSAPPVPGIVEELGKKGTKAVIIISAGFEGPEDSEPGRLRQAVLDAARPYRMRVIGPNCLGFLSPIVNLNASFAHLNPPKGRIAFATQSGAVVTSVIGWAAQRGIGFSHLASLGDMTDVDFGDLLDYLANDGQTKAILLYVEQVTEPRKFISAARAAARTKPVIVVKGGKHAASAKAVASHTGSLAGNDEVYDAVFRRAGMLRVDGMEKLFEAVEVLAMTTPPKGDRVAVLTNGGGIGVMAIDTLLDHGGKMAQLSEETLAELDKALPAAWSKGNPVDVLGDAGAERYHASLTTLLKDRGVDAILSLHCPTAVGHADAAAQALSDVVGDRPAPKTIISAWVGEMTPDLHKSMTARGIPAYDTPEQAVRALMYMIDYRRAQDTLMETPSSAPEEFVPDRDAAKALIQKALDAGHEWLSEAEAKQVLAAYGVSVVPTHLAHTPHEAAEIAAQLSVPVVVKILSADVTHKSDVGGVALNLLGPSAVERAAREMLEQVAEKVPDAEVEGFTVQPMVHRPDAFELIVGVTEDPQFGPVILFGHGGTAVEAVDDVALGLPPLNMHLANELLQRTRIHRLLAGYRDHPAVDLEAVKLTMIKVAQLVTDIAEIAELDINPLLADDYGVMALDARIRVQPAKVPVASQRLAIRPYPVELEERIPVGEGKRELFLRPVMPEDEHALHRAFAKLSDEEIRLRFFAPLKTMSHIMAARFTQIDYDREMALILTDPGIPGTTELYGTVSLIFDPDFEEAEYALLVRGDMTGMGLGILLMRRMIDYARRRRVKRVYGDVLRENTTMLKLCKVLGFRQERMPDEPDLVRVALDFTYDA